MKWFLYSNLRGPRIPLSSIRKPRLIGFESGRYIHPAIVGRIKWCRVYLWAWSWHHEWL